MDHCSFVKRKKNPRETANVCSKLSFAYTTGLFKKGFKQDLEEKNVYEVIRLCNSKRCGDKLEKQWYVECKISKPGSIYKLLWHRFGTKYLLIGFIDLFFKILSSVLEPLSISKIVDYFNKPTDMTKEDAYMWVGILLGNNLIYTIYSHNSLLWAQRLGMEMRTAFSALLYRKALRLTPTAVSKISLGNIVTLITKDVYTFQLSIWMINDLWNGSLQMLVYCYLLYSKIGVSSMIGIGVILSVLPLQIIMGRIIGKLRYKTGTKTDERLQETQETLSTIKIIKMYTWEKFFSNRINTARKQETSKILITFQLKMAQIVLGILFSKLGFYLLIMSYIWLGYNTNTALVFYISNMFKDLEYNLGSLIPYALGQAAYLYAAITRIHQVIVADELPPKTGSDQATNNPILELKEATVDINKHLVLKDVSFKVVSGLILVTGRVGSGKSSLLKALLQDYPLSEGSIMSRGRISYASQDPWLFPSSIKQNIIFGEEFNEKRYLEVVRVCALEYDFKLFEKGDETIVSDRGLNLSKGQQARINLARAVYKESEIYLLDDSLTSLDSQVQEYIFSECMKNFLKGKICILVTQCANQLKAADKIVFMEDGRIKTFGKPDDGLIGDIGTVIGQEKTVEQEKSTKVEKVKLKRKTSDDVDEEVNLLEETQQTNKTKIYSEENRKGKVSILIYKDYLMYGGGTFVLILNLVFFALAQGTESYSDFLLAKWVDKQHEVQEYPNITENSTFSTNSTKTNLEGEASFIIKLYSASIFLLAILNLIRTYTVLELGRRASVNIHKAIIRKITNACMSFFDTHFLGNILNRFSNDFNNVDEQVPFVIFETLRVSFEIAGILFIITNINKSFILMAVGIFSILLVIRRLYLPTGRSLKRLEATTRSPMVGHINASLEGLTTIRAYKMEQTLINEFDRHQDLFTSAHYMWQCTTSAFSFSMDFICSIFISCVVLTFILIDTDSSAGDVGLAISQVIALSGEVDWGVRQWADLESYMTSVERLLEYTNIKTESTEGRSIENWPEEGTVAYEDVSLTYNDSEMVLKNLNFVVAPSQKIGIVGRTGAGKSSIMASIFRLYEVKGKILIDGVDIKTLSLDFLRRSLAIIPQDPILFSGTIRTNLDPYNEFTDQELWQVLEKVTVKSIIPDLNHNVKSYASSFSSGQRQLISVARAILRKSKIVILDEATANMDKETDLMLAKIIKDNFSSCTVFTIAHRLETILENDKVIVMDRGEIREFGEPKKLLENKNGMFYKLVEQAGLLSYLF